MAVVVTIPRVESSGKAYVFDKPTFTITGASGDYVLIISGVSVKLSAQGENITYNAGGIIKSLFKHSELENGQTTKTIPWELKQSGTRVATGTFQVGYGSWRKLEFPTPNHINVKWIDTVGIVQTKTLFLHQSAKKQENVDRYDNYYISMIQQEKLSLYLPLTNADEYNTLSSIYTSAVVQIETTQGWQKVEVDRKESKRGKAALQDFEIALTISYER